MDGGEAVVRTLVAQGLDTVFTVPGESFLYVLEALRHRRDRIRLITTRHESGAAFAAEAYGKLTGRPAAVIVSRGPGATNASIGLHTASQDSTPMVLLIGDVRRRSKGREAFQEIDHHRMFGAIAKAVVEPVSPEAIPDVLARAVAASVAGRPGPVVVVLPRDLTEAAAGEPEIPPAIPRPAIAPDPAALGRAAEAIETCRRPLIIAGEMVAIEDASASLGRFAEACGAPVMAAYRRQDVLANDHPAYGGHLEINRVDFQREAFDAADLIVVAGSRLDGITSEEERLIRPEQTSIQIYPDGAVLRRSGADHAIEADVGPSLTELAAALGRPPPDRLAWRDGVHRSYRAFSEAGNRTAVGSVDMARVVGQLAELIPADATILTDGGSFARWVHRYYRFTRPHTQAGPMSGAMGYAVPGALGAALARPEAPAVAFVGDGGFMMTGQELVTAVEQKLAIKVIVCDNRAHGSILLGQQHSFGSEADYGTLLTSPDFAAVARAYGVPAWRVDRTEDFASCWQEAFAHDGPAVVHLLTDRRDIAPYGAGKDAV